MLGFIDENRLDFALKPVRRLPIFPEPETFDDLLVEDKLLNRLKLWFEHLDEMPPALLLHAPAGYGKTSIARVACRLPGFIQYADYTMMFDAQPEDTKVLYINGSETGDVHTLRRALEIFYTNTYHAARTLIFIDEAHDLSEKAKQLLKPAAEYLHQRDGHWGVGGNLILLSVKDRITDDQLMSRLFKLNIGNIDHKKVLRFAAKALKDHNIECDLKLVRELWEASPCPRDFFNTLYYNILWDDKEKMSGRLEVIT